MSGGDLVDPSGSGAGPALWVGLPTACPTCGAAVDQAAACRTPDPRCPFCRGPLPCTPMAATSWAPAPAVDQGPPPPAGRPSGTSTTLGAELRLLSKADGGRHTPVFDGYRPQIVFAGDSIAATVAFDPPTEMLVPGEATSCSIQLATPVAMTAGQTFDVLEGDRRVGHGTVRDIR